MRVNDTISAGWMEDFCRGSNGKIRRGSPHRRYQRFLLKFTGPDYHTSRQFLLPLAGQQRSITFRKARRTIAKVLICRVAHSQGRSMIQKNVMMASMIS